MSQSANEMDAAVKAVYSAVEELTFLSVEPAPTTPEYARPVCWVSIRLVGMSSGRLVLIAPVALARRFVATVQGLDEEEVNEAQALDGLSEVANVASGELVRAFSPGSYELRLPQCGLGDTLPVANAASPIVHLMVEGLPLAIRLENN